MVISTTSNPEVYKKEYNGAEVDTYKFLLMDETETRNKYQYKVNGIDYKSFVKNPVLLSNHDPGNPIGAVVELERNRGKLYGYVYISKEEQKIENKVKEGVIRASSITVKPIDVEPLANNGNLVNKSELLEVSLVTIPNNRNTVRNQYEVNMELEQMENKLSEFEKKFNSLDTDKNEQEIKDLKNSFEEFKNSLEDNKEMETLKNEFEEKFEKINNLINGLQKKTQQKVEVKDVETYPLGDLAIANFHAMKQNKKPLEVMKNNFENGNDFEKQRWTKAIAQYVQNSSEDTNVLYNSYNLGSIADGSTLADPNNALPLQEILRRENTLLNLPGLVRLPFVQGRITFPVQNTKGTAGAYLSDGTDTPDNVESSFKQVDLYVKEVAGEVVVQNHMLRYGAFDVSPALQNLMVRDILDQVENYMLYGTGASGQPVGLLTRTDIETSSATGSASVTDINSDIAGMRKQLAENEANGPLSFLLHRSHRIGLEQKYNSNADLMYYSRQLQENGTLQGLPVQDVNAMSLASPVAVLLDPSKVVVGTSNGVQVSASEHVKFREDQTVIKGIIGFDIGLSQPSAVYKLDSINEWGV